MPRWPAKPPVPQDDNGNDLDLDDQINALDDNEPETVSIGDGGGYAVPKKPADTSFALNGKKKYPLTYLLVTVDRDSSSSPATWVPEYEVEVLKAIHNESAGEEGIRVHQERSGYTTMNAAEAHAALKIKYGSREARAAVEHVYRSPSELARATGLPFKRGDDLAAKKQEAQFVDHSADASNEGGNAD